MTATGSLVHHPMHCLSPRSRVAGVEGSRGMDGAGGGKQNMIHFRPREKYEQVLGMDKDLLFS